MAQTDIIYIHEFGGRFILPWANHQRQQRKSKETV